METYSAGSLVDTTLEIKRAGVFVFSPEVYCYKAGAMISTNEMTFAVNGGLAVRSCDMEFQQNGGSTFNVFYNEVSRAGAYIHSPTSSCGKDSVFYIYSNLVSGKGKIDGCDVLTDAVDDEQGIHLDGNRKIYVTFRESIPNFIAFEFVPFEFPFNLFYNDGNNFAFQTNADGSTMQYYPGSYNNQYAFQNTIKTGDTCIAIFTRENFYFVEKTKINLLDLSNITSQSVVNTFGNDRITIGGTEELPFKGLIKSIVMSERNLSLKETFAIFGLTLLSGAHDYTGKVIKEVLSSRIVTAVPKANHLTLDIKPGISKSERLCVKAESTVIEDNVFTGVLFPRTGVLHEEMVSVKANTTAETEFNYLNVNSATQIHYEKHKMQISTGDTASAHIYSSRQGTALLPKFKQTTHLSTEQVKEFDYNAAEIAEHDKDFNCPNVSSSYETTTSILKSNVLLRPTVNKEKKYAVSSNTMVERQFDTNGNLRSIRSGARFKYGSRVVSDTVDAFINARSGVEVYSAFRVNPISKYGVEIGSVLIKKSFHPNKIISQIFVPRRLGPYETRTVEGHAMQFETRIVSGIKGGYKGFSSTLNTVLTDPILFAVVNELEQIHNAGIFGVLGITTSSKTHKYLQGISTEMEPIWKYSSLLPCVHLTDIGENAIGIYGSTIRTANILSCGDNSLSITPILLGSSQYDVNLGKFGNTLPVVLDKKHRPAVSVYAGSAHSLENQSVITSGTPRLARFTGVQIVCARVAEDSSFFGVQLDTIKRFIIHAPSNTKTEKELSLILPSAIVTGSVSDKGFGTEVDSAENIISFVFGPTAVYNGKADGIKSGICLFVNQSDPVLYGTEMPLVKYFLTNANFRVCSSETERELKSPTGLVILNSMSKTASPIFISMEGNVVLTFRNIDPESVFPHTSLSEESSHIIYRKEK